MYSDFQENLESKEPHLISQIELHDLNKTLTYPRRKANYLDLGSTNGICFQKEFVPSYHHLPPKTRANLTVLQDG